VIVGRVVSVTDVFLERLFSVAVSVAVPMLDEVSVAVAAPAVVERMVVFVPVSENVPIVVVNCTAVPSGTAEPFCVTVAVTFTCELTSGLAFETVSVIVAPLGGVTPPGGTVEVVGGAVGDDSPLQPTIVSARRATRAISRMRNVVVFMSKPPSTLPALRAAGAVVAEIERNARRSRHALPRHRLAEHFQDDVHLHDRTSGLRVPSAVLRQQRRERRL